MPPPDRDQEPRRHHRPMPAREGLFDSMVGDIDPAERREAADRCAQLLVRGARGVADEAVIERLVNLTETEGLEPIAELWSGSPPDSLAGALWRLFALRAWVYADPLGAAEEFDLGRAHSPVAEVVAGVTNPPSPDEVRLLADTVLRGLRTGDLADTLFRAAAFTRVAAAGRARRENWEAERGSTYDLDVSAARLLTMADQLEQAGRLELEGRLG